jgi:hypothetical protein
MEQNDEINDYKVDIDSIDDIDELPYEIDFIRRMPAIEDYIDLNKLHYNDSFKTKGVDHIIKKMPSGSGYHIPGWHKVLETMAESISDSPLNEMIKLSIDNVYERNDPNLSKFKDCK